MIKTIVGLLLVWSAAWLATTDAAIAFARGWRPGNATDWTIVVLGFAGTAALGLSVLLPPLRKRLRARGAELILLGSMIAVSLTAVEVVLRSLPPPPPPQFHQAPANLSVTVSRKNEVPKKTFSTNSDGIRGPEFAADNKYRILCIGGSTTQCHYMDDSTTWTHLFMQDLRARIADDSVWVGATGIPGFATPQHLKYLQTNSSLSQYTHAVFLVGVNDVLHWLSFKMDGNKPAEKEAPPAPRWQTLVTYQRLVALFSNSANPLMNAADAWPLEEARRQRAASKHLDAYAPPGRALNGYRDRINAMIDRCQELGVVPVFVTQPVLWAKDLPPAAEALLWMGATRVDGEYISTAALSNLMDLFNATLIQTCHARDIPVVDLTFMSGSTDYFFDDCHFTDPGAAVVAQTIADAMANHIRPPLSGTQASESASNPPAQTRSL